MLQLHFAKAFEKQIRPYIDKVRMVCCFLYQCMMITSIFNFLCSLLACLVAKKKCRRTTIKKKKVVIQSFEILIHCHCLLKFNFLGNQGEF